MAKKTFKNIESHAFNNRKHGIKKPNKATASEYMRVLYDTKGVNKEFIAALYQYFLPTFKKPKNLIEWVSLAKSKEATRYYITEMHARDGKLVATDGHRLHVVNLVDTDLDEYLKGYISLTGAEIELGGQFPEYERVIPEENLQAEFDLTQAFEIKQDDYGTYGTYIYLDLFGTRCKFNLKYWQDAVQKDTSCQITKKDDDSRSPVKLTFDNRMAVIMPTRIEAGE